MTFHVANSMPGVLGSALHQGQDLRHRLGSGYDTCRTRFARSHYSTLVRVDNVNGDG